MKEVRSDLDIKGCEANLLIFEVQRVVDSLRLSADLHATWHPSCQAAMWSSQKKVHSEILCFQGGVLENFGFRDGKPQEGFLAKKSSRNPPVFKGV